jgi:hypothetical protein
MNPLSNSKATEYFVLITLVVWESWKLYVVVMEGLPADKTVLAFIVNTVADPLVWVLVIGTYILRQRRRKISS